MTSAVSNITIKKGKTFSRILRWESTPFIYKAITGITQAAPAVLTVTSHGLPDGWRLAVLSPGGMREIAAKLPAKGKPPLADQFHQGTVLTSDTIALNDVNSLDFTAYTTGGAIVYYTPIDLDGFTARLQIRSTEEATGDPLVELTTENGGITLDNTAKTITITIAASATEDLEFLTGVYDLELVSDDATPVVTQLLKGSVTVEEEVTR